MVSRSPDDFYSTPPQNTPANPPPLPEVVPRLHRVTVPVFLTVLLTADDDLHAEVLAAEAVRALPPLRHPTATITFASLIAPISRQA